jgi:hypothetical protein
MGDQLLIDKREQKMKERAIPEAFIEQVFRKRKVAARKMATAGFDEKSMHLEFLRHTPAVATFGTAGLNLAVKGIGFILEEQFMDDALGRLKRFIEIDHPRKEALDYLLEHVYDEERVDFHKLSTLELAKKHTFQNITGNRKATLMFFIPPETCYEVRCKAEIHVDGVYHEYVNAVHDLFHRPETRRDWSQTPAYIFNVQEIYDNSPRKMGKQLY